MTVPAPPDKLVAERFAALKQKRDELQKMLIKQNTIVESGRARYANIISELEKFGVGNLQELKAKIADMQTAVNTTLTQAEAALKQIEDKINEIENKEINASVGG
jgi:hypothetical protein